MMSGDQAELDYGLDLPALLTRHKAEYAAAWVEAVHTALPDSHYSRLPQAELLSRAEGAILAATKHLRAGPGSAWPETGLLSPRYLLRSGFDIAEVVQVTMLSLQTLPQAILAHYDTDSPAVKQALARTEASARQFLGEFIAAVTMEAQAQVREEQQRTAMLLEAAKAASSTLKLTEVLRGVAAVLASAAGTPHCWFYLLHRGTRAEGAWADLNDEAFSTRSPVEFPASLLFFAGMERKRPLVCRDLQANPALETDWSRRHGLRSVLSVPLMVEDRLLGIAVALCFGESCEFAPGQIELAQGIANVVAPAIENARLYRKVERIAVMEERLRLARELHDSLAQRLGYLSLKTGAAAELAASGQIDRVEKGLAEMRGLVADAYIDLREALFCLRASVHSGPEFWTALCEYLEEYNVHYGVDAQLLADADPPPLFAPTVATQVSRIILEAMTNVRKHSKAGKAWVRVVREDDKALITIEDDGRGFDAGLAAAAGGDHLGLRIMRERAESVGGTLALDSCPGRGTRVLLQVPLAEKG